MILALPILLLCLFILSFWMLADSKVKWQIKSLLIVGFCFFTIVLSQVIPTYLGWGASDKYLPKVLSIRSVIIKEPDISIKDNGAIYFLIEQPTIDYHEPTLKIFAHNVKTTEPRLFSLPYSRELHEELAKDGERSVIRRTQRGQIVRGTLVKGGFGNDGKNGTQNKGVGDGKGNSSKGSGSESQNQKWTFYDLKPSYFQEK
ncbi:MAG: hypothetical protein FJY17_00260 [Bacteroidetes bacterium]|nr:hypothetical protein [Bacteroidota bacterium]